jgi:serine/threonine-protein kinase
MIGEVLGNYRITDQIGSGGMGLVYEAEHILLGKKAAIKVLKPERCENPEIVERFFNEARAASMVKAPGIPEIFDYGRLPEGNAYLVMEMLEGQTLGHLLEGRARLTPGRSVAMARLMAGTLKATHAHGIIHRDLKPDNVFVVPDPAMPRGERIKILDFGIAKLQRNDFASSVQTETGRLMGTPYYMSPEQCRGAGDIDHRTDIYSLGCVLYQMLCGRPPFVMKGSGEVLAAHIHLAPKPVASVETTLPAQLEAITMRLLAKDPDDRPQTMQEVMDELNKIASFAGLATPEPSLAASTETPVGLENDTIDDFQRHKKTTTLEASSGEYQVHRTAEATQLIERPSVARQVVVPLALVAGLAFGAWGAWTVLDKSNDNDKKQTVAAAPAPSPAPAVEVEPPIIVRELVEVPAEVNYVSLAIDSVPGGARVYRVSDGVELGRTPFNLEVAKGTGTMTFLLRKSGYKNAKVTLPVGESGSKQIKMDSRKSRSDEDEASTPEVKTKPTPEASPPKEKPAAEKTDSSSEFGGDAPDQL